MPLKNPLALTKHLEQAPLSLRNTRPGETPVSTIIDPDHVPDDPLGGPQRETHWTQQTDTEAVKTVEEWKGG